PVERFGSILVYRGTFDLAGPRAFRLTLRAMDAEYSNQPELAKAAEYLKAALEIHPAAYWRWIELGNVQLQLGLRAESIQAYENARAQAPAGDEILGPLAKQIQQVSQEGLKSVPILRNPKLE